MAAFAAVACGLCTEPELSQSSRPSPATILLRSASTQQALYVLWNSVAKVSDSTL